MYGILLSAVIGTAFFTGLYLTDVFSLVWSIVFGALAFVLAQVAAALILKKKSLVMQNELQTVIRETQLKVQKRQNQFMLHPSGDMKQLMAVLQKEQNAGCEKALQVLDRYNNLSRWNFIIGKQLNTLKMAFLFQLKRFEEVDALLPKCLFFDAQAVSICLARMYVNKDPKTEKFFRTKFRVLKGENCVLPVAVYTWMLVQQNKIDEAIKIFVQARQKTDNEILERNWKALVNNKVKQFSNSGFSEQWYALGLEEMKLPRQQMRYPHR